jgi:hypothetical protein
MKTPLKKWDNADDRKDACIAVLKKILSDDHFRRDCLARMIFFAKPFSR